MSMPRAFEIVRWVIPLDDYQLAKQANEAQ